MTARPRLLAFAFLAIAVAVFAVRPVPTPGPLLRDFEAYWSAGSAWNAGGNPYSRDVWTAERTVPGVDASRDELLPFVGPPASLLVWSAFARLPYAPAARVWYAVLALALLGTVLLSLAAGGARLRAPPVLAGIALAIGFGPVTSDLALGQVALLAFFGAAAVVALATAPLPLGALAAFAAFFQPNVAPGMLVRFGWNRPALALVLGALATYAAGAVFAGWGWPAIYAATLIAHGSAERFSAIQLAPGAIAHGAGASDAAATAIAVLCALAAVAAAIAICVRVRDPFARFAACSALLPFVAGFFHEHDLLVAFPAAVWCALRARGTARAWALGATLLVAIDWLGLAQRPSGVLQSLLLAAAAACAFAALADGLPRREALAALLPVAAAFAAAAALAATHPSPVWPDALGAFSAAPAASAAHVWREELRRSGLLAVAPVWSLLRAISLAGCAGLAICVARARP